MMVPPSAVCARMSLSHEEFIYPREDSEEFSGKGGRGVQGDLYEASLLCDAGVGGVAASTGRVAAWDALVLGYEYDGFGSDRNFTSSLAASILWQSSAPSISPLMTSVKKSMMRAAVVGLLRGRFPRWWAAWAPSILLYRPGGRWYRTYVLLCGRIRWLSRGRFHRRGRGGELWGRADGGNLPAGGLGYGSLSVGERVRKLAGAQGTPAQRSIP